MAGTGRYDSELCGTLCVLRMAGTGSYDSELCGTLCVLRMAGTVSYDSELCGTLCVLGMAGTGSYDSELCGTLCVLRMAGTGSYDSEFVSQPRIVPYQWLSTLILLSARATGFHLDSGGARRNHAFRCEILGFRHGSIQVCSNSEFVGGVVCFFVCLQREINTLPLLVDHIPPTNAVQHPRTVRCL
jgi:hypothetical protein